MNASSRRRLFAAGAITVALGAVAALASTSMVPAIVPYWSPTELLAKRETAVDATVRIMGQVEPGSVQWDPGSQRLAFRVTDGAQSVAVVGQGAPPQMFREGIGCVVEGELGADGVFHSDTVMVKHNNEYKAPHDGENPADAYKTLAQDGT